MFTMLRKHDWLLSATITITTTTTTTAISLGVCCRAEEVIVRSPKDLFSRPESHGSKRFVSFRHAQVPYKANHSVPDVRHYVELALDAVCCSQLVYFDGMIPQILIAPCRYKQRWQACPRRRRCSHRIAPCVGGVVAPKRLKGHFRHIRSHLR